jgi:hypothetical protein
MPHLLCVTNLILHDIEVPKIRHDNSLSRPLRDYNASDMVDIVVTNPPFGGAEEDGIELNFPQEFRTKETADLFLVLIMKLLKDGGRCGIILPDGGTLSGEGIEKNIREKLLTEFNLHTIVRLPTGVFSPYTGIKTNLLFFEKGKPTKEIWYFEHPLPEDYKTYNKGKPIQLKEFNLEKEWWVDRDNEKFKQYAWKINIEELKTKNFNLDIKNPNKTLGLDNKSSDEIIESLITSFEKSKKLVEEIRGELKMNNSWPKVKLGKLLMESRILADKPDPNKRITVKLNVKGVEKRQLINEVEGATKYYIRKKDQFIYGKQNLHKGAFGLVPANLDGYESSADIPAFDVSPNCLPEWIVYYFKQNKFYLTLESHATGRGSRRIHPKQIFDLEILLPPIEIQTEVLKLMKLCDELENEVKDEQKNSELLMNSVLVEVFK